MEINVAMRDGMTEEEMGCEMLNAAIDSLRDTLLDFVKGGFDVSFDPNCSGPEALAGYKFTVKEKATNG
jgi:hypothetical protein